MFGSPYYQLFRRIAPAKAERRLKNPLAHQLAVHGEEAQEENHKSAKAAAHAGRMRGFRPVRKAGSRRRGFVLIEAMMGLSLLTVVGLVLLKLSLNILHPRQWILQQSVTDAYLTYERAYAERIPFENLLANDSPWPVFPATASTVIEMGRLPGGVPITGTVVRTRMPDAGNYPVDGGSGSVATNPAGMKVWRAQSVITYKVGGRNYAKSRTVLRSQ